MFRFIGFVFLRHIWPHAVESPILAWKSSPPSAMLRHFSCFRYALWKAAPETRRIPAKSKMRKDADK